MDGIDYDAYAANSVAFLQDLVRTPSVNGKDNEDAVAALVVAKAESLGLSTRIIEEEPGRPNVFVGEGFDSSEGLLLIAHSDTVPAGDESTWSHGPFSGGIVDGKLYGRGAVDCKGGLAIALYVLAILKAKGHASSAKLLAGVDEESGADSQFGIRAALRRGLRASGGVYLYGGERDHEFVIGHRGVLRVWVTCEGESLHSGSVEWQDRVQGDSAIDGIFEFIQRAGEIGTDTRHEIFPQYKTLVTPTLVKGGEGESIVPGRAEVLLDVRTLPGDNETMLAKLQELAVVLSRPTRRFGVAIKNNIPAAVVDSGSVIVQEMLALVREYLGIDNSVLRGSGPANESYMLNEAGIPTIVGFGPRGGGYHSPNEHAEVASFAQALEFLVRLSERVS